MNSRRRAELKKTSHSLKPKMRIGKDGFKDGLIISLNDLFNTSELVKIKILQNSEVEKHEIAENLAKSTKSEIVEICGNVILFYKKFDEIKKIFK